MSGYHSSRAAPESCCDDWICICPPGEWGAFEARPRDPEFLTEENARHLAGFYEHCDACWDMVMYVCEIPRQRQLTSLRIVDLAPARFRLCAHHGSILSESDSLARIHLIGSGHVVD